MNEAKVLEEMKRLKGTQTEKNLRAAYAGESQAHVKYNLFANEAEKDPECSRQIADLFRETANNERAHAKIWFWLVGDLKKTTAEHLKMAAEGEHDEWTSMYPEFAETAKKEGFPQIAFLFSKVGEIENPTKHGINCSSPMWKTARYLRRVKRNCGCALTAATP